jgi:hypothetical protein
MHHLLFRIRNIIDVLIDCLVRDGPFNFLGVGLWFFSKKNILIPNVAEKNILILVEEKKII